MRSFGQFQVRAAHRLLMQDRVPCASPLIDGTALSKNGETYERILADWQNDLTKIKDVRVFGIFEKGPTTMQSLLALL
ncbi:hypothetical protein [Sphingorhabdus sp.]|jgi:hypothetical protein|uniref:hypothetical protein n=1 Tax=Sphingorhabdus sp. TaxID=1902408 RepID=UPI0037840A5E